MLSTETKLTELVSRLKEFAAANLECVILFGSAARGDFHEGHSDLNVVCVLRSLSVEELGRLAHVAKWWCVEQKEPAPLFFTKDELRDAANVFAIEILDMKRGRRILYGADVVADIEVPMNLHRVQIEHDLRTILVKLRQHYLRAPGNAKELAPVLRKSFSGALTGSSPTAYGAMLKLRETGEFHGEIVPAYGAYLKALEKTLDALEHHFPKREWRRVKNAHS